MKVNDIHAAVISAYREALVGSDFENIRIEPVDRETQDVIRGQAETDYDYSHSREMGLHVTTVSEELYYYATNPKKWKIELNNFQELMEQRLLKGINGLEINDIDCESGRYGDTGGAIRISFEVVDYEVVDYDGRESNAEMMEDIDAEVTIETN